ncbi:MAG: hypothetical protein WCS77_01820 [Elusimicrobiaceae bacterium]
MKRLLAGLIALTLAGPAFSAGKVTARETLSPEILNFFENDIKQASRKTRNIQRDNIKTGIESSDPYEVLSTIFNKLGQTPEASDVIAPKRLDITRYERDTHEDAPTRPIMMYYSCSYLEDAAVLAATGKQPIKASFSILLRKGFPEANSVTILKYRNPQQGKIGYYDTGSIAISGDSGVMAVISVKLVKYKSFIVGQLEYKMQYATETVTSYFSYKAAQ